MTTITSKPLRFGHVFISFSQENATIAHVVANTLKDHEIPVWIAPSDLRPGAPDWEAAIRNALTQSLAVVLLASPQSRTSTYVRGELKLAEAIGRPIYPFWIDGTIWSDCVPLGMAYAQYIDGRGRRSDKALAELCLVLRCQTDSATPRHALVSPLRAATESDPRSLTQAYPPSGYVSVALDYEETDRLKEGGQAAFLRIADYSCVQAFLDDLYIHYLRDRFAPFTYGISWCLEEVDIFDYLHLFLLPWSWLLAPEAGVAADTAWLQQTPLRDCGVRPQTSWLVRTDSSSAPTGLALNDERIFSAMKHSPKVERFLRREGVLKDCPIPQVESAYHFRHVAYRRRFFGDAPPPGTAIVQTTKRLSEIPGIEYWLERA